MVNLTKEDVSTKEEREEVPPIPEALWSDNIDHKAILKRQLEDWLPPHDKAQDDVLAKLPHLIYMPDDTSYDKERIYEKLCTKKVKLAELRLERDEINKWLWAFYKDEIPDATIDDCRGQIKKLYEGKHKFLAITKHCKRLLYKLHIVTCR